LSLVESSISSSNLIVMSFCMEKGCGFSVCDEGHVGDDLCFLVAASSLESLISGVRDGVQNDGSEGLAACNVTLASAIVVRTNNTM
jgi:hypothetical protein